MGNRKRSQLKKLTASKEFTKFVAQSAASSGSAAAPGNAHHATAGTTSKPQSLSRETAFTWKLIILSALSVVRIGVVFLPQSGYIQPDEFFQFSEPVAGDVLGVESFRAWEFNQTAPLRSMFFPALFTLPVFQYLKMFYFTANLGNASTYVLLIGPRLLMTIASFGIDFAIYRLCRVLYATGPSLKTSLSHKSLDCLLAHATCYLAYSYYTHTFSNTIETILFGLLLVSVVESLRQTDSRPMYFKMSILLAVGFFNRPTFAVFAFVPMLYWLTSFAATANNNSKANSKSSRLSKGAWLWSLQRTAGKNGLKLMLPFTLSATLLVLLDTGYHRGLEVLSTAISELSIGKAIEYIVLTPRNFLQYNLQTKNLSNHGLHPVWFHAAVCMPWLFTLLAIIFYLDILVKIKSLYPLQNIRNWIASCNPTVSVLYLSILLPLIGFSLMPHQEPRFILPLVIPLFCLLGYRIFTFPVVTLLWLGINFNLAVFYGHIHQAGVIPSLAHLQAHVVAPALATARPTTLIFARQYLPPRHLLAIPKHQSDLISIHDLSILDFPHAFLAQLAQIRPSSSENADNNASINNHSIYLTIPGCLTGQLRQSLADHFPNVTVNLQYQHFPHFSAEDLAASVRTLFDGQENDDNNNKLNDSSSSSNNSRSFTASVLPFWWGAGGRLHESFSMNIWKLSYSEPEAAAAVVTANTAE